ncbi:MAG TPA: hypothetical protein VKN14_14360, partial [Flavobacteriaceae bacterium]|nr:hypothetical protein [Flavobacteriaceae bacterium]
KINALNDVEFAAAFSATNKQRIDAIKQRLEREKGVPSPDLRNLFFNERFRSSQFGQSDALAVMDQISNLLSERQRLLIQAANSLKNISEVVSLNSEDKGSTAALFPSLNGKSEIPKIIEHMIEDETNDDLGHGSGGRFVIRDSQILNLSIKEVPPEMTLVEVNGLFGEGFVPLSGEFTATKDGGTIVSSAWAVDYDMWRMYGFRGAQPVSAPFFSNPDTQCAPFAVYLLNQERKKILQGNAVLVGNEYYQPGDVIYIESRDLLFYVEQVSHVFDYSGTFTTSLRLTYGHNPGEYIPTILDIVGKSLYQNKNMHTSYRNNRFDHPNGERPIGVVTFDNLITEESEIGGVSLANLLVGKQGNENKKTLNNIFLKSTDLINSISVNNNKKPVIKIRIYYNSKFGAVDQNLLDAANAVSNWLKNPQQVDSTNSQGLISIKNASTFSNNDNIIVETIDKAIDTDHSPSQQAWFGVRKMLEGSGSPSEQVLSFGEQNDQILSSSKRQDRVLYTNIIDVWLDFESIVDSVENTRPGTEANSQAEQENAETITNASNRRANT